MRNQKSEITCHLPLATSPSALATSHLPLATAFTLIELLVSMVIIAILAGVVLGALGAARETARESATKATIAKLHTIIMQKYESYLTRRVSVSYPAGFLPWQKTQVRLAALRDIMRMEIPERWEDVVNVPIPLVYTTTLGGSITAGTLSGVVRPALSEVFSRQYSQAITTLINKGKTATEADALLARHAGPECLYMQIATGDPEAMEHFNQSEIGDVDEDGLPEFLDGWGRPISFLRWAPGFNLSELQPNIDLSWYQEPAISQRTAATTNDHDPFDSRKVDFRLLDTEVNIVLPTGWRLVPLIYSFGSDGVEGLVAGEDYFYGADALKSSPTPATPYGTLQNVAGTVFFGIGAPDGTGAHLDNITNHNIEQR